MSDDSRKAMSDKAEQEVQEKLGWWIELSTGMLITPNVSYTSEYPLFKVAFPMMSRAYNLCLTLTRESHAKDVEIAELKEQVASVSKVRDEHFAEIQRAQRIIDDLKVNRESQIANIPHDVWEESVDTIHVAIKILATRAEAAESQVSTLTARVRELEGK